MKFLITILLLIGLVLVVPRSNSYAWTHCGTPQAEKDCPDYVSPTPRASHRVTPTPTATVSATPSATPTVAPSDTPQPTVTVRTDLTDGRSDGRGCKEHDCNTQLNNQNNNATVNSPSNGKLPETGGAGLPLIFGIAGTLFGWGCISKAIAKRMMKL